jgi:hypothetical protein
VLRATIFFVVFSACVPIRSAAQTGPAVPGGQIPMDATLSMLVQLFRITGPLDLKARNTFLNSSALSAEQIKTVLDVVSVELMNLEGDAARMRSRPSADFVALERSRHEALHGLALNLENKLGADGWLKFNSFLRSVEQKMGVHRDICDGNSAVYTFGTVFGDASESFMNAVAVADADYLAAHLLYAEATLRSPENREVTSRSPTSSLHIHAAASAALQIGTEDGTYSGSFKFGEFCGESKSLRMYTDQAR